MSGRRIFGRGRDRSGFERERCDAGTTRPLLGYRRRHGLVARSQVRSGCGRGEWPPGFRRHTGGAISFVPAATQEPAVSKYELEIVGVDEQSVAFVDRFETTVTEHPLDRARCTAEALRGNYMGDRSRRHREPACRVRPGLVYPRGAGTRRRVRVPAITPGAPSVVRRGDERSKKAPAARSSPAAARESATRMAGSRHGRCQRLRGGQARSRPARPCRIGRSPPGPANALAKRDQAVLTMS